MSVSEISPGGNPDLLFTVKLYNSHDSSVADVALGHISREPISQSPYRRVFQGAPEMKTQFKNFLETIFYQLDSSAVQNLMEDILKDEMKSDDAIYQELLLRINSAKKAFAPLISLWKALPVVRTGMGKQVAEHVQGFNKEKLKSYTEIYTCRYFKSVRKEAGLSFTSTTALLDAEPEGMFSRFKERVLQRIEVGSLFSPHQRRLPLNEPDCKKPSLQVDRTYAPIGDAMGSNSQDIILGLGGLHHTAEDRLGPFVDSVRDKLSPGAIFLLREHNAESPDIHAIASVVHSFVNAAGLVPLEEEQAEIRNFQPSAYWQDLLERRGFQRIDITAEGLVLPDDPTHNGMMAFVKKPTSPEEVETAALYQKNYLRKKTGSYATWIEWGNVRFAKQYAEFIQDHHSYAFDFTGHIYQHWTHFYHYMKKSLESTDLRDILPLLFSDNMAMNLFILLGTTMQLGFSAATALPSIAVARWKHGENWRNVTNQSALEKFEATYQKHYCDFIDYDPFFKYPYFQTIKDMWKAIYNSEDSYFTKTADSISAIGFTATIGIQGILSSFINYVYYSPTESSDQETIQVLLDDPNGEIDAVIERWNILKNEIAFNEKKPYEKCDIKVIYQADGRKLVSFPFYKPFTIISQLFKDTNIDLLKMGGQKSVTLDLLLPEDAENPMPYKPIYSMKKLHDEANRTYATYEVPIKDLAALRNKKEVSDNLVYIHVHR